MTGTEPAAVREWVGGRVTLPARIESMGDRRAEMSLWVELPDLQVVGHVLEDPEDPQASFGQSLMRAMASPLVGEPRRPQRVRVADSALAEQLESFSFLSVEVAPTPEFDRVVRSLGAFFGEGSYFSDPSLTPKDVERFFLGARALWAARPWTLADDDALVRVEVPAMEIEDGCLSILGSREEVRGFAFFPSYDDYDRMTSSSDAVESGEPIAPHRALYFSFDPAEEVPEGMRREVAEHDWPLADESAYPVLMRMVDGKPAPVSERELELATVVMRAIATLAVRHPQALEHYGDVEIRESQFDESDIEVILSVPHPLSDQAIEAHFAPRASTLSDARNPYGIPLEPHKLKQLERVLGAFTLHRALGLFCAVVSVPELPRPSVWLGEIMQHVTFADEAQARSVMELLMTVYSHVVSTIEEDGIGGLIPEAADVDACREWARGYRTILVGVDPSQLRKDVLDSAFAIHALAEAPRVLEVLDDIRGEQSRESMLEDYRDSLADDADFLLDAWAAARAKVSSRPREATFRGDVSKVGRNDPCPCGSGKKYKKCCVNSRSDRA